MNELYIHYSTQERLAIELIHTRSKDVFTKTWIQYFVLRICAFSTLPPYFNCMRLANPQIHSFSKILIRKITKGKKNLRFLEIFVTYSLNWFESRVLLESLFFPLELAENRLFKGFFVHSPY